MLESLSVTTSADNMTDPISSPVMTSGKTPDSHRQPHETVSGQEKNTGNRIAADRFHENIGGVRVVNRVLQKLIKWDLRSQQH